MATTFDFHGKTAVVTGGAKGIGHGISFSLQNAGANVHVLDIEVLELEGIQSHVCDVTDSQSITRAIQAHATRANVNLCRRYRPLEPRLQLVYMCAFSEPLML